MAGRSRMVILESSLSRDEGEDIARQIAAKIEGAGGSVRSHRFSNGVRVIAGELTPQIERDILASFPHAVRTIEDNRTFQVD